MLPDVSCSLSLISIISIISIILLLVVQSSYVDNLNKQAKCIYTRLSGSFAPNFYSTIIVAYA